MVFIMESKPAVIRLHSLFVGQGFLSYMYLLIFHGYIRNSQCDQLPVGLIAQLVKHCTGITEVMGSNPVKGFVVILLNM